MRLGIVNGTAPPRRVLKGIWKKKRKKDRSRPERICTSSRQERGKKEKGTEGTDGTDGTRYKEGHGPGPAGRLTGLGIHTHGRIFGP